MACWLFKEEPTHYSFGDLEKDGTTVWDGVKNPLARRHLREIRPGDRIFFYHTGKDKAVVGEMRAVSEPQADPRSKDPKAVIVKVEAVRRLPNPVPLSRIKGDQQLTDWELVRLPRLSVMPVTEKQWKRIEQLSKEAE
jgi:predicted RNA-binding protein with PUA-like domain